MTSLLFDTVAWSEEQFATCSLGDKRRSKRLVKLASQVVSHPSGGLPEQTETWGDLKAAYRLLDRAEVTFEAVAGEHWRQTRQCPAGRYLVLCDTTELDFGIHRQIPDLAPTGNGGGWGFLLHSGLMVAADGEELIGLAGQTIHYRKPRPKKENAAKRMKRERESKVWGDVIDQVGQPGEGVEWVHVMDRGADGFEVYCHCLEQRADWVVRVTQRQRNILTPEGQRMPLAQSLETLPVSGMYELELRSRPKQPARTAKVEVRYGVLEVPPPAHKSPYVKHVCKGPIRMWVIWAREVKAAEGVEPIEWVLLTSLPVNSFDDAWEVLGYYERRWLIEEWHKALKSGCRVTESQLKAKGGLEALVGLLSVVSVRLVELKSAARSNPDRPAREMVPLRWITLLQAARKNRKKARALTVGQFYRELAKLGGFIGRRHDGDPGWITIWRGWQKLCLMVRGAELATNQA
ncbi:MAG: IS4 family transposase [Candidatus Tenebribacter davisii]|nr:IS4 family transposase [Candidatus Tenebribacter davisii]